MLLRSLSAMSSSLLGLDFLVGHEPLRYPLYVGNDGARASGGASVIRGASVLDRYPTSNLPFAILSEPKELFCSAISIHL